MNTLYKKLLATVLISSFSFVSQADPLPDYYAEPGFNPFRDYESLGFVESIDPLSGGLQRHYIDLVVPGNGGLDIVIRRFYRAPAGNPNITGGLPDYLGVRSVLGQGWDMHFGRIWHGNTFSGSGTTCGTNNVRSGQNPILELADGTRKELLDDETASPYGYVTKDLWIGICESGGLTVVSPEGTRYTFDYYKPFYVNDPAWHVTRIEDKFGNTLNIEYHSGTTGQALVREVSASDGRNVTFHYNDLNGSQVRLDEIRLNNSWRARYHLSSMSGTATETRYYLNRVERRSEGSWYYDYYTTNPSSGYGLYALEEVRAPTGLVTNYDYTGVQFQTNRWTTVLDDKTVTGADVNSGIWTYGYTPSNGTINYDRTTIRSENYCTVYEHQGAAVATSGNIWRIGTLMEKKLYNNSSCGNSSLVQTEEYTWSNVVVSDQDEAHRTSPASDNNSVKPVLSAKRIIRDGDVYLTTYSNFDTYGNPRTISEDGPNTSDTRTTTLTYQNFDDTGTWVLGLVDQRTISGEGTINHDYYTSGVRRGSLQRVSEFGRTARQYDYYTSGTNRGALRSLIDEEGNSVTYSNYYRGIPETENYPGGVRITRNVNSTGTVQWEEDGNGRRTSFTYDYFNRVTSIVTPRTNDSNVTINWSSGGRVRLVTRGTFSSTQTSNGYGNLIETSTEGIRKRYRYNAEGYLTFESYLSTSSNPTEGTTFTKDVLNRATRTLNQDGTDVDYDFTITEADNAVSVTNERNKRTVYRYRSYGDPDEKHLIRIDSPESVVTVIGRDRIGNITSVTQGGWTRTFNLDSRNLLDSEVHPETGTTDVSTDDLGNIISRRVGGSATTYFNFDGLNRLDDINYPAGTPDVNFIYDNNSNIIGVDNTSATWDYTYDTNNNLNTETAIVQGLHLLLDYDYDTRDNLESITYPNGLTIALSPDDLGRPTSISGFVSNITYHPNGQSSTIAYVNGRTTTITQDNRRRINTVVASGVIDLDYGHDGNGNVTNIVDRRDGSNTTTLTYDDIDRLETANGPWGSGTIGYTTDGDIDYKNVGGININHNYSGSNNRLTSITGSRSLSLAYDTYGNVTGNGRDTFEYNDASQLTEITNQGIRYAYDGNNRRIIKYVAGVVSKISLYNKAGLLMYETDRFHDAQTAYIYLGSTLIARQEFCSNGDHDGDGLGSCIEIQIGLDPSLPDTDGNGTADGAEDSDSDGIDNLYEATYGLDLQANDSALDADSDGLTNLQEFNLGTASDSGDSDNDQLPDLWEFTNSTNPLANDAASDFDGDRLTNLQEYTLGTRGDVRDTDSDGLDDDLEDFDSDELNNYTEFQLGTLPQDADTDNDLMRDGYEVNNGLNPLEDDAALDADSDTLTNLNEMQRGTDPQNPDTDGDGVSDGDEVAAGTDPLFNFAAILPAILHIILN